MTTKPLEHQCEATKMQTMIAGEQRTRPAARKRVRTIVNFHRLSRIRIHCG
jgi:hypothetical protein